MARFRVEMRLTEIHAYTIEAARCIEAAIDEDLRRRPEAQTLLQLLRAGK